MTVGGGKTENSWRNRTRWRSAPSSSREFTQRLVLRKILSVDSARHRHGHGSVGLQNMGALKALATEGIQRGHMSLHARQAALAAGVDDRLVDEVADRLIKSGDIKVDAARAILAELNGDGERS